LDKNKRRGAKGRQVSQGERGQRASEGLEIETGFQKWITYVREYFGCSYPWNGPFANDRERVEAIERETELLTKIAPEWNAETFYSACTSANPDFTKGSEHYVTRYRDGLQPRVVKATIPGKYGRYEYSPSLYLNSWRLFEQFLPALDIRVHGVLTQPVKGKSTALPSIVTSMQYIQGGHPSARQITTYMKARGWSEYVDPSETQDYIQKTARQIIRDAHPGNWIKQRGTAELIPVDISIEEF